ncbi:PEP-CTERM sorting domain-containing protein [Pseudoduganella chitinolytica]|uniref:PEP-CTERM sorting domain-containing protein n=1 Tax=Pseudoduganella chitinolytica TaxID=34070 RepID=A0ABY8BIG0_9BURK|nr:PEP-CTERM sorting domain-containing protein [Pseudoduganella chitinolytica]WEF34738.1 PEP-CTERM sorting domain-containing protein [Pseudoduganella chitinolytica]
MLAALLGLGLACAGAQAQTKYSVTSLSSLTPGHTDIHWQGINNAGDLAGFGPSGTAYSHIGGQLGSQPFSGIIKPIVGNDGSFAFNASEYASDAQYPLGFGVVVRNGVATRLPMLDGRENYVAAINDASAMVGWATDNNLICTGWGGCRGHGHAVVFANGSVTDLGKLAGYGAGSIATSINNHGVVVGSGSDYAGHRAAFVYENGAMRNLEIQGDDAGAVAINDAGLIAGTYMRESDGYGTWLMRNGTVEYFGFDGRDMTAVDLNNAGQVIGNSGYWGDYRPWILVDGKVTLLNDLLQETGWTVGQVWDLNDKGQIVADVRNASGEFGYAVLTPVPEPGSYAMLAAGVGVLAVWRRRRGASTVV